MSWRIARTVPATLEQNLLAFQYGQDHHGLSLVDEWMLQLPQTILSDPSQLLQRLARSAGAVQKLQLQFKGPSFAVGTNRLNQLQR